MLDLIIPPIVAGLVILSIHAYLGLHVIQRGVIFVDLAFAQIAALGATIAVLVGITSGLGQLFFALGFTLLGALIFSFTRMEESAVPQEAIIGITFVVASAAVILIAGLTAEGAEHIRETMTGTLIWIDWPTIWKLAGAYAAVGAFHFLFRKRFLSLTFAPERVAGRELWDFLFYVSFGVVIAFSVDVAGVLMVFSALVIPGVVALLFTNSFASALRVAWGAGALAIIGGIGASFYWDLPTGPLLVCAFGLLVVVAAALRAVLGIRPDPKIVVRGVTDESTASNGAINRANVAMKIFGVLLVAISVLAPTPATAQQVGGVELMELTIARTHDAMLARTLTARSLVEAYLARIEAYDKQGPTINSLIMLNPRARERADELDEYLARTGSLMGPLHGIPVIVKDNYDTHDMPTTGGSASLEGSIPADDAYQVRKIREAGAIVLAKSNLAEFAFTAQETVGSMLPGWTFNPYALNRVTAGSSGGTAASVASNFGLVGLGTDTGNSIRGPSGHNALVGIRSTQGLTSRDGIMPLKADRDIGGPMTRSLYAVLERILSAVNTPDPIPRLNAALQGRYAIQRELGEGGMATGGVCGTVLSIMQSTTPSTSHPPAGTPLQEARRAW